MPVDHERPAAERCPSQHILHGLALLQSLHDSLQLRLFLCRQFIGSVADDVCPRQSEAVLQHPTHDGFCLVGVVKTRQSVPECMILHRAHKGTAKFAKTRALDKTKSLKKYKRIPEPSGSGIHCIVMCALEAYLNMSCANSWRLRRQVDILGSLTATHVLLAATTHKEQLHVLGEAF